MVLGACEHCSLLHSQDPVMPGRVPCGAPSAWLCTVACVVLFAGWGGICRHSSACCQKTASRKGIACMLCFVDVSAVADVPIGGMLDTMHADVCVRTHSK